MNELKLATSPSIEQLREWIRCDGIVELDKKIPARSYYEMAPEMMKMVHRYIKTDQAELALILIFKFMRYVSVAEWSERSRLQ
ncbi:unnamed protein product [Timema podura]|uniref:USP8 dimerisation domain-containing protein n=1 Tax=Timema podura TaxID=61482 RepID=A0ABN7P418_TIMPD|nr:unnamed protein product [Timema podura]